MTYRVILSLEAVDDVMRITMASDAKAAVVSASKNIQEALQTEPAEAGQHLSEGLYFIDREPLRAFFTIDTEETTVEIVNVRQI